MDFTNTSLLVLSLALQTNVQDKATSDTNFVERVTVVHGTAYLGIPLPEGKLARVPQPIPVLISMQTNFVAVASNPTTNGPASHRPRRSN